MCKNHFTISNAEYMSLSFSSASPPSFALLLLTHSLCCATDGRVAVSGALLVSLDLLSEPALHTVTAALYQVVSTLLQACQAILKACYFLHDGLWRTKSRSRLMLERVSMSIIYTWHISGWVCPPVNDIRGQNRLKLHSEVTPGIGQAWMDELERRWNSQRTTALGIRNGPLWIQNTKSVID